MIRKLVFCSIGAAMIALACNSSDNTGTSSNDALQENQFGQPIDAEGAISYANLLEQMEQNDSLEVKVKGTVQAVCQAKGCWMNIAADDPDTENMMVKFKDYGFFVPKDIAGKEVVMQGFAFREVTPVDELRHLAQDAGQTPEEIKKITESKVELKFLASGVLLLDAR